MEHHRGEIQGVSIWMKVYPPANWTQNRDVSFTYGCLDPVMVTQMAKYLDTVYVSGWQCSSTASSTDEPGPDLADYPMVSISAPVSRWTLIRLDHRPQQGATPFHGPVVPRPEAARRATHHTKSESRERS